MREHLYSLSAYMHRDRTSLDSYASPELFYLDTYMHHRRYATVLEHLFQDRLYELSSLGRELIQTVLEQTVQDRLYHYFITSNFFKMIMYKIG